MKLMFWYVATIVDSLAIPFIAQKTLALAQPYPLPTTNLTCRNTSASSGTDPEASIVEINNKTLAKSRSPGPVTLEVTHHSAFVY